MKLSALRPTSLALAIGSLLASCAVTSPAPQDLDDDHERFSAQLVYSDIDLDDVSLERRVGSGSQDVGMDRQRIEARLNTDYGFGTENGGSRFFLFTEQLNFSRGSQGSRKTDLYGIGGGMWDAPRVAHVDDDPSTITYVVPYDWNVALAYGDDRFEIGYGEIFGAVGFGLEWNGLQPSLGLSGSYVHGRVDDGDGLNLDLEGFNLGFHGQVKYAHPELPIVAHMRLTGGDIQGFQIGAGMRF